MSCVSLANTLEVIVFHCVGVLVLLFLLNSCCEGSKREWPDPLTRAQSQVFSIVIITSKTIESHCAVKPPRQLPRHSAPREMTTCDHNLLCRDKRNKKKNIFCLCCCCCDCCCGCLCTLRMFPINLSTSFPVRLY